MRRVSGVRLYTGSSEEVLPGYAPDFPLIASHNVTDYRAGMLTPWHWHQPAELFYIVSGTLVYMTPGGEHVFPAGSGGLVNANVLHRTRPLDRTQDVKQYLYIFDAQMIGGGAGSRITRKYVEPMLASGMEIAALDPGDPQDERALRLLRDSFELDEQAPGYELRLMAMIGEIWLRLFEKQRCIRSGQDAHADDRLKKMMLFAASHYMERIRIADIAAAGICSERECYRAFEQALRTTPGEYLRSCRLREACRMLADSERSVTEIAQACGFGSGSRFAEAFRERMGCTPLAYRRQDSDKNRRD